MNVITAKNVSEFRRIYVITLERTQVSVSTHTNKHYGVYRHIRNLIHWNATELNSMSNMI